MRHAAYTLFKGPSGKTEVFYDAQDMSIFHQALSSHLVDITDLLHFLSKWSKVVDMIIEVNADKRRRSSTQLKSKG